MAPSLSAALRSTTGHRYATQCDGGRYWNGTNCTGVPPWKMITTGEESSCGIKQDNTLWCWGEGSNGRLGDNTATDRAAPVQISGGGSWKSVDLGWAHGCGIRADDTMRCWGFTYNGSLGDGTTSQRNAPVTLTATGGWNTTTWKSVSAGSDTTCAIRLSDDALYCWGSNDVGGGGSAFGNGVTTNSNVPVAAAGGGAWKSVSVGATHVCGIRTDDTVRCWGANYFGQLGDNTSIPRLSPVTLNGGGTWKVISAGSNAGNSHTCGIKTDDSAWCWGLNASGQLGDNTYVDVEVPTAVNGGGQWLTIMAGAATTCGIRSDSTLRCWGSNYDAQVGDGTFTDRLVPVTIGSATWKWISSNGFDLGNDGSVEGHTCGITTNDVAMCWGRASAGQLGDNTNTSRSVPTAVYGVAGTRVNLPWNNGNATGKTNIALSWTDGAANTTTLVASDSNSGVGGTQPHQAAAYCDALNIHSYGDWYLPSSSEANTMFMYLSTSTQDVSDWEWYWTSTHGQDTTNDAQIRNGGLHNSFGMVKETVTAGGPWIRCMRKD